MINEFRINKVGAARLTNGEMINLNDDTNVTFKIEHIKLLNLGVNSYYFAVLENYETQLIDVDQKG